jgi:endonuclease YncB( thermonuclease family)
MRPLNALASGTGDCITAPIAHRARGFIATSATAAKSAVVVTALVLGASAVAQDNPVEFVQPATRNVTPPGILPGPQPDGPMAREEIPPPPPEPARWHRYFLPETVDSATFSVRGRTIRISGVSAPPMDRACVLGDGSAWPCGRTALHAMRMFLRGRAVECYFPFSDALVDIIAPCRVGGSDLGAWLLTNGWARTGPLATEDYHAAERSARCAGSGLWRGQQPPGDCAESSG